MNQPLAAKALAALALAAVVSTARPAAAEEGDGPPSSGLGFIVTGALFSAVGIAGMGTAAACTTSAFGPDKADTCFGVSLGIGATFAAVGIPMLVTGVSRNMEYAAFRRQHPAAALLDVRLVRTAGGGMAMWQARF